MESLLGSDEIQNGLLLVVMGVTAWLCKTAWYNAKAKAWQKLALKALDAGIIWVYHNRVRLFKQDNVDKAPDDVTVKWREEATAKAQEFGAATGVDVKRAIGTEYLDMVIEQRVAKLKKENSA